MLALSHKETMFVTNIQGGNCTAPQIVYHSEVKGFLLLSFIIANLKSALCSYS